MSTIDTIRALFTYAIALVIVIGGGVILVLTYQDPSSTDLIAIIAGFMGAAVTFVFSSETQTRTARQSAAAHRDGAIVHANGFDRQPPSATTDAGGDR